MPIECGHDRVRAAWVAVTRTAPWGVMSATRSKTWSSLRLDPNRATHRSDEEIANRTPQRRQVAGHDTPDDLEVDPEVLVNHFVADAGDLLPQDLRLS